MVRKFTSFLICVLICTGLMSACADKQDEPKVPSTGAPQTAVSDEDTDDGDSISIAALKGPTALGLLKFMDDKSDDGAYSFDIYGTADEIVAGIAKGSIDIACVPCNVASVLYNRTEGGVQVAAINTLGVLYMLDSGESVNSVADLKGKTIYTTGKGTTPEYTLRYILSANGIDPDSDVTIEFKSEATEIAAIFASAQDGSEIIAMLPQPYVTVVTSNNPSVRVALDMSEEWNRIAGNNYGETVTGVTIVRREFAESNPEAFSDFLEGYNSSIAYTVMNVEQAAELSEKYDVFAAAVASKAIPECNITYIDGDLMKLKISAYLQALYDQNPQSVGGAMPGNDFYYGVE